MPINDDKAGLGRYNGEYTGGKSPSFWISAGGVLQGLLTRICLF